MTIREELLKATVEKDKQDGESDQTFRKRLIGAGGDLSDTVFESMSEAAQDWLNTATTANNQDRWIVGFDDEKKPLKKGALSERAMLVRLSISAWSARKMDKGAAKEVEAANGAEDDAGNWWTHLIGRKTMKELYQAESHARNVFWHTTLPWDDAGTRILPAECFLDFTSQMREARAEDEKAIQAFIAAYPTHVQAAKKRLGRLFKSEDFPTTEEVRAKFAFRVDTFPLPDVSDFRVDLGTEFNDDIRKEMEGRIGEAFRKSMMDVWNRLYEVVARMAEKLKDAKAVFRDSLIDHVREVVDILPALNVAGDAKLEEMRKEVHAKLAKRKAGELRDNPAERKEAAKAAADILTKMQAFMGKAGGK